MTSSLLANSELDFNSMSSETEHEGRSLLLVRAEGKRRFEQARRARAAQLHFDADADARRYHQKNENRWQQSPKVIWYSANPKNSKIFYLFSLYSPPPIPNSNLVKFEFSQTAFFSGNY